MELLEGVRSKVECATQCHANYTCRTAVYQADGDCYLIWNFADTFTFTDTSGYASSDEVIELRSHTDKAGTQVSQTSRHVNKVL